MKPLHALPLALAGGTLLFSLMTEPLPAADCRGIQFLAWDRFDSFTHSTSNGSVVLTSPVLETRIPWQELLVSWNAVTPSGTGLTIEARAFHGEAATRFFTLGRWASDASQHPRESVPGQKNADGNVDTDTLILTQPAQRVQVRVTLAGGETQAALKFLSLSLLDPRAKPEPLPPFKQAWGKTLPVPERSQMAWEGGSAWCSPTTISMLLAFWSEKLKRPELDHLTPAVVKEVFDPKWEGTGNWVFNTAYAGSFPGMRACTARLSDLAEVEAWITEGLPVGLSLCYNRLRGKSREPSGHLVVCVGFTKEGDAVINDPGTREQVRKVFSRERLLDAWAYSKNAAYLVYPEGAKLPRDRFGHWGGPPVEARE